MEKSFSPFRFAALTRLIFLVIQVIFHQIGHDYDSSSFEQIIISRRYEIGKSQVPKNGSIWDVNQFIQALFGGYSNWDSVYFLNIASNGYEYEQTLAFFPVFPMLMCYMTSIFQSISFGVLNHVSSLMISGFLINLISFSAAAVSFHKLTLNITNCKRSADISVLLFCINPATIFFNASYSESLFAFFQFSGMLLTEEKNSKFKFVASGLLFAGASGTRSNGILSAGFLGYALLLEVLKRNGDFSKSFNTNLTNITVTVLKFTCGILLVFAPFVRFQHFAFQKYCMNETRLSNLTEHWCFKTFPRSYSYVQSFYWNVGPFRYFQWKQIPNFIIALPVILLSYAAVWSSLKPAAKDMRTFFMNVLDSNDSSKRRSTSKMKLFENTKMLPYTCHLLFLVTFGIINIHIQVLTRILFASNPILLWYITDTLLQAKETKDTVEAKKFIFIWYLVSYALVGTLLHCNFYPWT